MKQNKNKNKVELNQPIEQAKPKSVKPKQIGQSVSNGVKLILYGAMILVMGVGLLWSFSGASQSLSTAQEPTTESTPVAEMTIEAVITMVNGYCDSGDIKGQGLCNSLLSKLEAAIEARDRGQPDVACNQLNAFINEVAAQNENKIPADVATKLIDAANLACQLLPATPEPTKTATPISGAYTPAYSYPIAIGTVTILEFTPQPTWTPTPTFEPLTGEPIGGYVFSTAQPVPNTTGSKYSFIEWVSSNELLVRKDGVSLELLDMTNGSSRTYVNGQVFVDNPVWIPARQAVAYLIYDEQDRTKQYLQLSDGNSDF